MEQSVLFCILILFASYGQAQSNPLVEVCPDCEFNSLGAALKSAPAGATVILRPGVYTEHDLIIDRPLKIRGGTEKNRPVLDLQGQGSGLIIRSDEVEISGLEIRNSGFSHTEEMAGIKISKSSRCLLQNNALGNNAFGIYIAESHSCRVLGNRIRGTHKSESLSGNGIHIWNSENIVLENNTTEQNRDGIYFEFVKHSTIHHNFSGGNLRYGLHFMYSNDNEYRENTFDRNDCGVAVMYSHNVRMFRNRFVNSRGPSSYGILLKEISDSVVAANRFEQNTSGILIDGATRTQFEGNYLAGNGWAVRAFGDTDSNRFTRNDFIGNTFDVTTNAGSNQNEFIENYWSRYRGLDLDKDGYGDEPFQFVSLSSMLMEHYGISILLINSTFFSILDQIENALPLLTPRTFLDRRPRMTRSGQP